MLPRLLFFLLLCMIAGKAATQELHYDHLTVRDGLLQMQVTTLFQDSKGHLWVGTKLGASRFDGAHFKNFTIEDGLPEAYVHNISEDSLGRILLLTRSGLLIVDGEETSSFPTSIFKASNGLFSPVVKHKDSIFIYKTTLENQLEGYYFDGTNYILMETYFPPIPLFPESYFYENIMILYDPPSKTLYAGSGKWGIHAIKDGQMSKVADVREAVQSFSRGLDGELYVGFDSHFGKFEGGNLVELYSDVIPITHLINSHFVVDQNARIIYRENDTQRLVIIDNEQVFKETFKHGPITALLIDREGNLWIGTEKGLYRNNTRAILNFIPKDGGINEYIWSVSEDRNGAILFASLEYGLQKFQDDVFTTLSDYKSLSKNNKQMNFYMGSLRTSNGDVYLPVTDVIALRYDGKSFYSDIPFQVSNVAFIAYEDPDDASIFFGTHYGLFNLSNGQVQQWNVQPGNGKSRSVTSVAKDKFNRIWIGGFNGLSMLKKNEIRHLPNKELNFQHGGIALLRDSIDNIWIGNPHGLFLYDYHTFRAIEHPSLKNLVLALAMVGDSALLIGAVNELLLLDLKSFYRSGAINVMKIGPDKGYHAIEPGQNGFYRDTKGYYWLTNSDRVVRFDPAQLATNPVPPTTYIRSVSLMDDRMNWNPLSGGQLKSPVFYYSKDEKNIRFEFTAVSLRDPKGITYSHFLEGYDKGWSAPDHENSIIYTNLQPGEYSLRFKAANTDGVWSEEQVFSFVIQPAYYQTLWFKISGMLLAAAILFFGGVGWTNQQRQKQLAIQENEKKLAQFQLLSIKNQIDPHFTYNAINSIAAAVMKEDKEVAYRFFVKLSNLMRSILNTSDKLTRTLDEELAFVRDYLEIQKFRQKDRFNFEVDIDAEVDMDRKVPKMCIQTFVENALKHGLLHAEIKGVLKVGVKNETDQYVICIEDNGIGREKARQINSNSAGKGLHILKGYFDYFNTYNERKIYWETTDLKHEDGTAAGLAVRIVLPKSFNFNV